MLSLVKKVLQTFVSHFLFAAETEKKIIKIYWSDEKCDLFNLNFSR